MFARLMRSNTSSPFWCIAGMLLLTAGWAFGDSQINNRGLLGIMLDDYRSSESAEAEPVFLGSQVVEVTPGLPADRAGIRVGDVIVAVDEESVESTGHLQVMVSAKEPGRVVSITLVRESGVETVPVRVGSWKSFLLRTPTFGPFFSVIQLDPVTPELRKRYRLPEGAEGLVVTRISEDSIFHTVLSEGVVIEKINGSPVLNRDDVLEFMRSGLNRLQIVEDGIVGSLAIRGY